MKKFNSILIFTGMLCLLVPKLLWSQTSISSAFTQWKADKYSMFIHFGIYSELGGVWKGRNVAHGYSEQIQAHAGIYSDTYAEVARRFNPIKWNPDSIALLAKEGGMRSIVITAKHHDGFCLFDSKYADFDIIDATPYKRDIIKELSEACSRHGLKFGLYFSLIDWHFPQAYPISSHNADFITPEHHQYNLLQVEELLSQYGRISELWFDMGCLTKKQSSELADLVHRLQPGCLVSGRIGNNRGDFNVMGDNKYPDFYMNIPWQTPASIFNETWGYRSWQKRESEVEKIKEKLHSLVNVVGQGGNYLLNIGPKGDGSVVDFEAKILRGIGAWLKVNGQAVFDTRANPFESLFEWGETTYKDQKIFLLINEAPKGKYIDLPGLKNKVEKAYPLWNPSQTGIKIEPTSNGKRIHLPQLPPAPAHVIVLEYAGDLNIEPQKASDLSPGALRLNFENAKKYYSFSGKDYYSNVKSIVKEAWYLRARKASTDFLQFKFTEGEVDKNLKISLNGRHHTLSLADAVKLPLKNDLTKVSFKPLKISNEFKGSFGYNNMGVFNDIKSNNPQRFEYWESLPEFNIGNPFTIEASHMRARYFWQEIESEVEQEIIIRICGGQGMQVWLNGEERLLHQYVNQEGYYKNTLLLKLEKGKNHLIFKAYNRTKDHLTVGIEISEGQYLYKKHLQESFKKGMNELTIELEGAESIHENMRLRNLIINLK